MADFFDEMGSRRMSSSQRIIKPPGFIHTHYRCDKSAFFSILAFVVSTLLAQVVLTLRFVVLSMVRALLIVG